MKKLNVLPFQNVKNWYLRMFLIITEFFLLLYIISCVALYFLQDNLIFIPKSDTFETPAEYGIEYDNIYFSSGTDKLHAYYAKGRFIEDAETEFNANDYTILYCHGNAGNISHRSKTMKTYHDYGFNIFVFDYSGYGQSSGRPSAENVQQNALDAWDYLINEMRIPANKIIVLGRSMGGFAALSIAEKHQPFALSLESTFSSILNIAQHQMPIFPARLILKNNFDNLSKISKVKSPLFMVHSKEDNVVKYYHSQKLLKAAKNNNDIPRLKFTPFIGTHNHCYTEVTNEYHQKFFNFMEKICLINENIIENE
ncbi:alpha/beta hydrolase [Lentisphaerota bacterium WC36G]|nr:alpha/beta hydrolase [Lentisphaerae bacterium WC36]